MGHGSSGKIPSLILSNALTDEAIPVYGDGRNVRDWIYVEDHCRQLCSPWKRGDGGHLYVGARNERRNIDVLSHYLMLLVSRGRSLAL